jgi:hypothetical protein
MPCSYHNHDRLEFLESDKEALLCLKFVTLRTVCGLRSGGWSLPCVMSD